MDKTQPIIIGICGGIASGKSTIQQFFVNKGFIPTNFADSLKAVAKILRLTKREHLQMLGDGFRLIYGTDFWVNILDSTMQDILSERFWLNFVIGDVRYPNEYQYIKQKNGKVIGIKVSPETQYKRLIDRQEGRDGHIQSFEHFKQILSHPSELNVKFIVPQCDYIIDAEQSLNDTYNKLNGVYEQSRGK